MSISSRRSSTLSGTADFRKHSIISSADLSRRLSATKERYRYGLDNKMWSNTASARSIGLLPGRTVIGPLLLICLAPIFVIILQHTIIDLDGSIVRFWQNCRTDGLINYLFKIWPSVTNPAVWKCIGLFMIFEFLVLKFMPGDPFEGPVSPAGNVPKYVANGFQSFLLTIFLYLGGVYLDCYDGGVIYDNFGEILATINLFAIMLCLLLYFKGLLFPSSTDSGSTGNPIFDFYWGTELYPSFLGVNLKHWTNCRCGMMFWALVVVSCVFKQYELHDKISSALLVNAALQLIYIAKFYIWESGYLCSVDIMHDRAGFYIIWGVFAFLPSVYTSHSLYLVQHPLNLGLVLSAVFFIGGCLSIWINYDADRQRQNFRAIKGNCKIWGKDPFFIEAKYRTESGDTKSSLILGSGWWGIARHFHYVPEILAAVCWTVPVMSRSLLPYFYVPYLSLLLFDRAVRDDARCSSKYGKYWDAYCKQVPYMVLPYIF